MDWYRYYLKSKPRKTIYNGFRIFRFTFPALTWESDGIQLRKVNRKILFSKLSRFLGLLLRYLCRCEMRVWFTDRKSRPLFFTFQWLNGLHGRHPLVFSSEIYGVRSLWLVFSYSISTSTCLISTVLRFIGSTFLKASVTRILIWTKGVNPMPSIFNGFEAYMVDFWRFLGMTHYL